MRLSIEYQDRYSRGQLLLRTFFGWLYICIPHMFLLAFVSFASGVVAFVMFWIGLFTASYPEGLFRFQLNTLRWTNRLGATLCNLVDGYPAIGLAAEDTNATLDIPRPESISRGSVLLRGILGSIYVGIPHGFVLAFREIGSAVLMFLAWWAVLFTGKYPERWHGFNVGTLRWGMRIESYLLFMEPDYPPFSGKE